MWRKGGEGYCTKEPEAIFGEQKYNWREWKAEEKSLSSPPRELSLNEWVSEEIPRLGPFLLHHFSSSQTLISKEKKWYSLSLSLWYPLAVFKIMFVPYWRTSNKLLGITLCYKFMTKRWKSGLLCYVKKFAKNRKVVTQRCGSDECLYLDQKKI